MQWYFVIVMGSSAITLLRTYCLLVWISKSLSNWRSYGYICLTHSGQISGSFAPSMHVFYLLSLYFLKVINWQINWLIDWLIDWSCVCCHNEYASGVAKGCNYGFSVSVHWMILNRQADRIAITCTTLHNSVTTLHKFTAWPTFVAYLSPLCLERYNGFTPEKRDNNYTPVALTPTTCLRTKFN